MALATLTCTEHDLNSLIACLRCVSKDDLLNFQVLFLLQITGQSVDPNSIHELMCTKCHSDEDLMRMETALWAEMAVATGDRSSWNVQDLMNETKCFKCTDPHIMRAAKTLLLCTFLKMT